MSEYQYYDFKAVDHALTKADLAALRAISTRAVMTSTSFTNHYEWGDLKADPQKLLEKYFDAFVYLANWGTREFCLRLPLKLIDVKQFRTMLPGRAARVQVAGEYAIVRLASEIEPEDDWDDGAGWMGSLIALRSDLLRGDLRCLYLAWLLCVQDETVAATALEPAVPDGLKELSAPLESLIEFLGIDEDLVEVAASASAPQQKGPAIREAAVWIQRLPVKDKEELLLSAFSQPAEQWKNSLLHRFRESETLTPFHKTASRRKAGDLLAAAHAITEEKERKRKEKIAAEEARKKAQQEAARAQYLEGLAKREGAVWKQVSELIEERKPKDYDKAIHLLTDLHDLAVRRGREFMFDANLEKLRDAHAAKSSFLRKLEAAHLC